MLILFSLFINTLSYVSGKDIAEKARTKIGCPYVYGAAGPDEFDCSGLVMWVHKQFGINLPRVAADQANGGREGDGSIGDVVAFGSPAYHVGICLGDGTCIHAPKPGKNVQIVRIEYMDKILCYRRYYDDAPQPPTKKPSTPTKKPSTPTKKPVPQPSDVPAPEESSADSSQGTETSTGSSSNSFLNGFITGACVMLAIVIAIAITVCCIRKKKNAQDEDSQLNKNINP